MFFVDMFDEFFDVSHHLFIMFLLFRPLPYDDWQESELEEWRRNKHYRHHGGGERKRYERKHKAEEEKIPSGDELVYFPLYPVRYFR